MSTESGEHRVNGGGWVRPASDILLSGSNETGKIDSGRLHQPDERLRRRPETYSAYWLSGALGHGRHQPAVFVPSGRLECADRRRRGEVPRRRHRHRRRRGTHHPQWCGRQDANDDGTITAPEFKSRWSTACCSPLTRRLKSFDRVPATTMTSNQVVAGTISSSTRSQRQTRICQSCWLVILNTIRLHFATTLGTDELASASACGSILALLRLLPAAGGRRRLRQKPRVPVFPVTGTRHVSRASRRPARKSCLIAVNAERNRRRRADRHRRKTTARSPSRPTNRATVHRQGDYVVTVQWFKLVTDDGGSGAGPNVMPKEYASPTTSPVKVSVKGGPTEIPPIAINSRCRFTDAIRAMMQDPRMAAGRRSQIEVFIP